MSECGTPMAPRAARPRRAAALKTPSYVNLADGSEEEEEPEEEEEMKSSDEEVTPMSACLSLFSCTTSTRSRGASRSATASTAR